LDKIYAAPPDPSGRSEVSDTVATSATHTATSDR